MTVAAALDDARAAKVTLAARLAGEPAVVGIGVGRAPGGWAVRVDLARPVPELALPGEIDGVPVLVTVVGRIRAQG